MCTLRPSKMEVDIFFRTVLAWSFVIYKIISLQDLNEINSILLLANYSLKSVFLDYVHSPFDTHLHGAAIYW